MFGYGNREGRQLQHGQCLRFSHGSRSAVPRLFMGEEQSGNCQPQWGFRMMKHQLQMAQLAHGHPKRPDYRCRTSRHRRWRPGRPANAGRCNPDASSPCGQSAWPSRASGHALAGSAWKGRFSVTHMLPLPSSSGPKAYSW